VKLLFDENLSADHARAAREAGHDAVSVVEIGLGGASDEAVRARAIAESRVLVTLDADFYSLLRYPTLLTAGVIRVRPWPPTENGIRNLLSAVLTRLADRSLAGKMVVAEPGRIRIR
jgi:predicted nuclease of predicted toxin-antitoxin system